MRVLLTAPALHGHVRPLLALGDDLRARGHDVPAHVAEGLRGLVPAGVTVHTYESSWSGDGQPEAFELPRDDVRHARAHEAFAAQHAAVSDAYAALLGSIGPDVVVADTTSRHVAEHRGGHATVWHSPTYVTPDVAAALRVDGGEDPILVSVAPLLHPHVGDIAGLRFIGPHVPSFERAAVPDTVFVSAGTSFNQDAALFSDAIIAVDGLPYRAVVATGDPGVAARLERRFGGTTIAAWVDQPRTLAGSAAFVSTGGMGSLQQAVLAGVPCVVVPQSPEQRINAGALAAAGCAVVLEPESVTPDLLTRAIRHLTTSGSVRSALAAAAEQMRSLGGVREGADIVEQAGAPS